MKKHDIFAIREKYNLNYHVDFTINAENSIGLKGKDVLEVGGTLKEIFVKEFIAPKKWVCVENDDYYESISGSSGVKSKISLESVSSIDDLPDYSVINGRIENVTSVFDEKFDAIFSIACFEHIEKFPAALDGMYRCLRPGGYLYSEFAPIWTSHLGHHLNDVVDKNGKIFHFGDSPIPLWGHLLMSPPEMYEYLLNYTDSEAASEIVYNIYNSTFINRLFVEDYEKYIEISNFEKIEFKMVYNQNIPEEIFLKLMERHPNYKNFSNEGLAITLRKPL